MMSAQAPKLSDAEILQILERAQEEYAQYIKLSGIVIEPSNPPPNYSWDNPIGLVINADLD